MNREPVRVDANGTRIFECPVKGCNKASERKYNIQAHMRTHTDQMPYFCGVDGCDMRFKWRSSLVNHRRYHSTAIPATTEQRRPRVRKNNGKERRLSKAASNFEENPMVVCVGESKPGFPLQRLRVKTEDLMSQISPRELCENQKMVDLPPLISALPKPSLQTLSACSGASSSDASHLLKEEEAAEQLLHLASPRGAAEDEA